MKKVWSLLLLFTLLAACNPGDDEGGKFAADLSGENEVCEGDTCGGTATGSAKVDINSDQNELCYELELEGVENVTAAHIHKGEEGEAGPVLVNFEYDGGDTGGKACLDGIKESDLEDISEDPSKFYVNVHSEQYPDGALRGQLEED